jgi:hypothetical protein
MTTAEQILEKALVHATVQTATDAAVDDLLSSSPGNRGSPYVVSTCTTALSRCLLYRSIPPGDTPVKLWRSPTFRFPAAAHEPFPRTSMRQVGR